jgi:rhamnulose-1-phosphate aldolase
MPLSAPYPELDELLATIGEAGQRLSHIDASEGAAGNISVCAGWPLEVRRRFPLLRAIELPHAVPALAGHVVLVTGSGRRLRDIRADPARNLCAVIVDAGGETGRMHTAPGGVFEEPTSELNSHLAVHADQVERTGTNFHAIIHAQPPHLTYLLPGSPALMHATIESLRAHRVVLWSKHGVMARSDVSATRAADRVEYAETAALYEYMNLVNHERAEGLTRDELRSVVDAFHVQTELLG